MYENNICELRLKKRMNTNQVTIKKGLKKIQARMGFAPMTFAILMHNCEDSFHIRLSKFVI